jgi:hypothetical protein
MNQGWVEGALESVDNVVDKFYTPEELRALRK